MITEKDVYGQEPGFIQEPNLTPDQVREILRKTPMIDKPGPENVSKYGFIVTGYTDHNGYHAVKWGLKPKTPHKGGRLSDWVLKYFTHRGILPYEIETKTA